MTANQIAYNAQQEVQRHNYATEIETNRHNLAGEQEVIRHNVAVEDLGNRQLAEQTRHNYMTEFYTKYTADTNREIAYVNASATRYAADRNYAASTYAANMQRQIASSNQANQLRLQQMKNSADLQRQDKSNLNAIQVQQLKNVSTNYATNMNFKAHVVGSGLSSIGQMTSSLVRSYPMYSKGGKP